MLVAHSVSRRRTSKTARRWSFPSDRGSVTSRFSEQLSSSSAWHDPISSGSVTSLFPLHLSRTKFRSAPMRDGSASISLHEQSRMRNIFMSPSSGLRLSRAHDKRMLTEGSSVGCSSTQARRLLGP